METEQLETRRLSRKDWLALALDTVSREGGSKLRVDHLVRSLGVTKGSFYWHFKDRDDFIRCLADHWARISTKVVRDEVSNIEGGAGDRLYRLMEIVTREDLGRYDMVMRSWATQEPAVATVVKEVDATRLDFVRSLFAELGFHGQQLESRTRIFACFLSLELGLFVRESKEERIEQLSSRHQFFIRP